VPAVLTCDGRRSSGRRAKHDQGDALVVARIARPPAPSAAPKPPPAAPNDPTGSAAGLALEALARLAALERDARKLEREIGKLLRTRGCTNLLATAASTRSLPPRSLARRAASAASVAGRLRRHTGTAPVPASSGRVQRHRLNRGRNRQLNHALYTVAIVQAR
jgi:hypothetical protein